MKLEDLTRDQKIQLKQSVLCRKSESVSYGELADADRLVSDGELEGEYGSTEFTLEDFCL